MQPSKPFVNSRGDLHNSGVIIGTVPQMNFERKLTGPHQKLIPKTDALPVSQQQEQATRASHSPIQTLIK